MLTKYISKSDGTTIDQHNKDLMVIKAQIEKIYNINEIMSGLLDKCIKYHDLGKVVISFQDHLQSKIRHEILSASIKGLSDSERLAIITHHKEISELVQYIENEFYESELIEMSNELNIEIIDIRNFIKK